MVPQILRATRSSQNFETYLESQKFGLTSLKTFESTTIEQFGSVKAKRSDFVKFGHFEVTILSCFDFAVDFDCSKVNSIESNFAEFKLGQPLTVLEPGSIGFEFDLEVGATGYLG